MPGPFGPGTVASVPGCGESSPAGRYRCGVNASGSRRTSRRSAAGLLAALALASSVAVGGHRATAQSDPGPGEGIGQLAELVAATDAPIGVSGETAVEALEASGTTEVAAANAGMEPDELLEELVHDPSMFVAADARVGYIDRLEAPTSDPRTAQLSAPAGVDVFDLNSRPSSGKVIYLDVDGHTTTDDFWTSIPEFEPTAAPYVSPPGTGAQRDAIYEIWSRVAEDYLPFDVNVTTRDPGVEGLRRTSPADQNYGQRIVISPTIQPWLGSGTLGIALLDVFDEAQDYSAFVFTPRLGPAGIAEAAAHEAGHTLGLSHDGTRSGDEYYGGHRDWAAIMGNPIGRAVTQWSRGEYEDANNREDDIAEIAAYTGFRADDHACVRLIESTSTTAGAIGAGGDVDVFAVDLGVGPATVALRPGLAEGSNLHAQVTVRDAAGVALNARPSIVTNWQSAVAFDVAVAGRYTIEVGSTGWLTPVDGFSTYGSLGAYTLQVTGADTADGPAPACVATSGFTAVPPARLLDTRIGLGGARRLPAGGRIALQVTGRGGVPVGATSAVLNVAAVGPAGPGFLTTFPCTPSRPTASTVNFRAGQVIANTTIATLSPSGQVCVYAHAATDVVVDVTGWLGQGSGSKFTAVGPTRVMDTRTGLGGATRLSPGGTARLVIPSLPAGTTAVALNVTSTAASGPGFATVYPCATGRPRTSTINYVAGATRPNNTIVGVDGGVCIYSLNATEIVVDLVGYFGSGGSSYLPTAPTRLLDTRESGGSLRPATAVSYRPAIAALGTYSAMSAAVNVTAVGHGASGFVTTFDCGVRGTTSTLNAVVGEVNANGAIVPLGNGLDSCVYTQPGGNLVVDLNGWWVR